MEEAEEMVAVKRAYAEIILNTAKEAAARVMASERKALRFQQDLRSTKDEALGMLLRLKQMLDSKTTEAEITSLSQQRRIEELDAQLDEAEGIITDLRLELTQLQDQLEKVKNERVLPSNGLTVNQIACFTENATAEDEINTSKPIISPQASRLETMTTSDIKGIPSNQTVFDGKCCNALGTSHLENYYAQNSGLASIIMRNKEPELYKNGCTQRIRAIERNLLDGNLLHSGDVENQDSLRKNELIAIDKDEGKCTVSSRETKITETKKSSEELRRPVRARSLRRRKTRFGRFKATSCKSFTKKSTELEAKMQQTSSCYKDEVVKNFQKGKRKRNLRCRNSSFRSPHAQLSEPCQPSPFPSRCNKYSDSSSGNSEEDRSKTIKNEPKVKSLPCLDPGSTSIKSDADFMSGLLDVTISTGTLDKFELVRNAADKVRELIDESVSEKEEDDAAESSKVAGLESNIELFDVPLVDSDLKDLKTSEAESNIELFDVPLVDSDSKDLKASKATNGSVSRTENNRLFKYTFRRKRKDLSNPDEKTFPEKSSAKRRVVEKQSSLAESEKSNLINELPGDS